MDYPIVLERKRRKRLLIVLFGICAILGISGIAAGVFMIRSSARTPALQPVPSPVIAQEPVTAAPPMITGRYLFNGTIFWGRGVEWRAERSGTNKYTQPFSGLDTFNRNVYDAWVADLECPVTDKNVPYKTQVDNFVFNCRPEYLPDAARYFNILNLANNHSDNGGAEGFVETRKRLSDAGIQPYGSYDPSVVEDTCEVIALPVKVQDTAAQQTSTAKLPVAFCAWHYFYRIPRDGEIERMDRYQRLMPVFAFVHMGPEYFTEAQPIQREIAHRVADRGPEFVIANNPHWVQDSEIYKGKLIVYSTGNFIFDQLDSEGMRSVSIDTAMTLSYDDNVAKWLELGESCIAFHDDCLVRAEEQGLTKPNIKLSFHPVAGDNSTYLTKKGDAALQKLIEERLKWGMIPVQIKQ